MADLRKLATGTFVQAGFDPTDAASVWVRFTDKPTPDITAPLTSLPYTVRVEYGAALNWTQLEAASEATFTAVRSSPGVAGAATSVDAYTDTVHIEYTPKPTEAEPVPADLMAKAQSAASSVSPDGKFTGSFTLDRRETLNARTEASVKGGHTLAGPTLTCSSGFSISVSGQKGVATAMHCENSGVTYDGSTGIITYANAASQTPGGNYIDLQWHITFSTSTAVNKFQADTSVERSVTSAIQPVVGASICHYGIGSSHKRCSNVYSFGNCYSPEDLNFCGLVATNVYVSNPGDSGGPWFYDNGAKGVHSGVNTIDGAQRSLFEPVDRITGNLNAVVLTS